MATEEKQNDNARRRRADPVAVRELAFAIARAGEDVAAVGRTPEEIADAKNYLVRVAETDGKLALGKNLILVELALSDAIESGNVKNALAALKQQAEVLKLCDFANSDATLQAESSARDEIVRGYLESTGVCRKGLRLDELARLVAQYVADRIFPDEKRNPEGVANDGQPE